MSNYITDDINIFSDDSDREVSDYSDKENSNACKYMKLLTFVRNFFSRNQSKFIYCCAWV